MRVGPSAGLEVFVFDTEGEFVRPEVAVRDRILRIEVVVFVCASIVVVTYLIILFIAAIRQV